MVSAERKERPRLLELFCGGKSVGKAAAKRGYDVISVDMLKKFNPTFCCDIRDFDFRQFPVGHFKVIHASPPCTEFSKAKTVGVRNIEEATQLVQKALEIIRHLKPDYWMMENPQGLLRHQPCMVPLAKYMTEVSYCKYGFKYRKSTDLWTNIRYTPRKCMKGSFCYDKKRYGVHKQTVQNGPSGVMTHGVGFVKPTLLLKDRYAIPPQLMKDLFDAAELPCQTRWAQVKPKNVEEELRLVIFNKDTLIKSLQDKIASASAILL